MNTVGHLINGQIVSDAARLQDVYLSLIHI